MHYSVQVIHLKENPYNGATIKALTGMTRVLTMSRSGATVPSSLAADVTFQTKYETEADTQHDSLHFSPGDTSGMFYQR